MSTSAEPFGLLKAAYRGDLQAVKGHLRSYTADVRGVRDCTCLHSAACATNSEIVDVLLEEGADINWTAADGATPLHVAAAAGNSRVAERLLQNPLVERDKQLRSSGFTAVHLAVTSGDVDTVAVLLKAGASFDGAACKGITPLHLAADLGADAVVAQLLNSHLVFSKDEAPTALHFACSVPRFDTVAPALHVLSCVDWLGPLPMNPQLLQAVVIATEEHHLEQFIPKDLHTQSYIASNVNAVQQAVSLRSQRQSKRHFTESQKAPQKGFIAGILQSMGCGGWLSSPPPAAGATARDVAIGSIEQGPYVATWMQQIDALTPNRFSRCAQMLIEWGCKVDARTPSGHTPLMYAAQACDLPLVLLLMEEKSSVSDLDSRQRSALHWCVSSEGPNSAQAQEACEKLIALLIESGLPMNAIDSLQRTPLQIACSYGNLVGVKALCKHGAQVSEKALLETLSTRDEHKRASIVRYLLDDAGMESSLHGSRASVIVNQAISTGPSDAAALILKRQRAKGTSVQVPDSAWLAAAEHVTDDDPLLRMFPLNVPATATALGKAWQTQKQHSSSGSSRGAFSDDGMDERYHLQLPNSTTTDLLKRVCKGGGAQPVDEHGNTLLHLAVQHAGRAEVAFLAKHKGLCTTKNAAGDLPVHLLLRDHASSPTLLLWMTQLMAGGVTADTADGSGVPMLCSAAAAGNKAVVKWLLDSGAYASAAATSGRGPLHYAAKGSIHHVEAIRESYDLPPLFNGATPGPVTSSMARRSTGSTQPAAASTYVVSGRRTSADGAATRGQGAGVSLFQALKDVATAYAQVIDTLVEHGAGVTATDLLGNTPVHEASTGAKIDIMKQLVAKGADLSIANHAGETCLHVAARHKSTQTVSYLVKEGAPLEAEDPNGRTPLHYACYYSSAEVISGLCRLKTDVNHVDKKRRTPLHVVVYRKHAGTHAYGATSLPSCRALVQHGAHINEPDSKMRTPLVLAYMYSHVRVAHYLWGRGAEPERSYGLHNMLFKQALQVSDNALVKHLLMNSRTLEVYHKDPSGASFLEVVIKELETKPFIAYADCIDELLGLRVPISLPALAGLWQHIVGKADKIRWVIDEEYKTEQEAKEASKLEPTSLGESSYAGLQDELEALNSKTVPVGAAHIPKSVRSMSTGSAVRTSVDAHRLAPVMEQDIDESKPMVAEPMPPGQLHESSNSRRAASTGLDVASNNGHSPWPPRSPNGSTSVLRSFDEERPAPSMLSRNFRSGDSLLNHKADASEAAAAGLASPPDGRTVVPKLTAMLSTSVGYPGVQSTFSTNPVRRVSAGPLSGQPATAAVAPEEHDGDDDVDLDHLVTTPSGLQALRWNVALGELLAHESDLFLPRAVAITSLRSALRASSMMLVQWRVDPNAIKAKIPSTGETALHVAAKCEMWVAAGELLRRGADTSATDKAGKTPLDAAINRMCGQESTADVGLGETVDEKVQAIRSSFRFKQLPDVRKGYAEDFLLAHLQAGQLTEDDAFATPADSMKLVVE